jgi:hypothetical protein
MRRGKEHPVSLNVRREILELFVSTVAATVGKWIICQNNIADKGHRHWVLYCKLYCN